MSIEFQTQHRDKTFNITELFEQKRVMALALQSGVMKRVWRQISVQELTIATIAAVVNGRCLSSPSIQAHLLGLFGHSLSRPALLKHLKKQEFGVFLKSLLTQQCASLPFEKLEGWLAPFTSVHMIDCSSWILPETEELCRYFPTVGGDCSGAGVKVGARLDWTNSSFDELEIFPLRKSDTMKMFTLDVKPKSLHLFDLGFFSGQAFEDISRQDGFFISRYRWGIILKQGKKRLNLIELKEQLDTGWDSFCTVTNNDIPVRLTVERLSDLAYQKRIKKIERQIQRKAQKENPQLLELARYNIFVSNIPFEILPLEAIAVIYSFRWQIELMLKVNKSLLKLEHHYWREKNLIQNAIYAVFLTYQTILQWAQAHRGVLAEDIDEISPWLVIKHYSWLFILWLYQQLNPDGGLEKKLPELITRCLKMCRKDNQEIRPTSLHKLKHEISFDMQNLLHNA